MSVIDLNPSDFPPRIKTFGTIGPIAAETTGLLSNISMPKNIAGIGIGGLIIVGIILFLVFRK